MATSALKTLQMRCHRALQGLWTRSASDSLMNINLALEMAIPEGHKFRRDGGKLISA